MGIRNDFKPYVDGNDLLAPNPVPAGSKRGSDNGPMFTSEYFVMLKKHGYLTEDDVLDYDERIEKCLNLENILCRAPGDNGQEGPDDYYGVCNGHMELGLTKTPRGFLWALIRGWGCLNNTNPGTWTGASFFLRQPQLIASMVSAAFPSLINPIHYLVRVLAFPLYLVSAIVLATSCMFADKSDTDARRLAWHLGNCVSKVSLLNWLAYKIWLGRLKNQYPNGMHDIAAVYYQPAGNNPYENWWVT